MFSTNMHELNHEKGKTVFNAFIEIVNESNCIRSKLRVVIKEENFKIKL